MKRKLIIVSIVSLLLLSLVGWRWFTVRNVDRRIDAISAAGFPTNGEELNNWYAGVPDDQNAALVITQAIGLLRDYPSTDARYWEIRDFKLPPRGQRLDSKQTRLLSEYVTMSTSALEKAHEAAHLAESRYPLDMREGAELLLPHLRLKTLARIEEYSALLALRTSRSNQAAASIANILDLARTLVEEPIVDSQIERTRLLACAKETLEQSLAVTSLGSVELTQLQDAFSKSEKTNLMRRALVGDRAMYIPLFRTNIAEIKRFAEVAVRTKEIPPLSGRRKWSYGVVRWLDRDLSFYLDAMETNIVALTLPPPGNQMAESNALAMVAEAIRRNYVVAAITLPDLPHVSTRERSGLAHLRLSVTALALERFRLDHKRLPENLYELVPVFLAAIPIDPFDGKPLRYRRLTRGFSIQSAGQDLNRSDDEDPWLGLNSDLMFIVER
jgi:hypothetical protein